MVAPTDAGFPEIPRFLSTCCDPEAESRMVSSWGRLSSAGVPPELRAALARLAVHEVAEAGALSVVTALDDPELHGLGFRPADGGGLALDTRSRA
jgi:hypothetical protein